MADIAADKPITDANGGSPRIPAILQLVGRLDGGPAARLVIDTAAAIVRAGGRTAVASSGGPLVHELDRASVPHHLLPLDNEGDFLKLSTRRRLRRLLEQVGANIVHVYGWEAARAVRPLRGKSVRLVATFLETLEPLGFFARRRLRSLARADRTVAPAQKVAGYIQKELGADPERMIVIPPGVNTARFSPLAVRAERIIRLAQQWRIPDDRSIILVPAPLDQDRGADTVIEAMRLLARHDIYCLLLGARPETASRRAELEKSIERKGLGGLVFIAEHCSDMPAAYMLADAVVVADLKPRPYSRIVMEAKAMGRPVLASDQGGIAEPLQQADSGWIFPPGNAAALAGALTESLALDTLERARLASLAIEQVRNGYALDVTSEQTLALYDSVLEGIWADART